MNLDNLTEEQLMKLRDKLLQEGEEIKTKIMIARGDYKAKLDQSIEVQKELRHRATMD